MPTFNLKPGFFLSPGQLQMNKNFDGQYSQYYSSISPPSSMHSRAISFNTQVDNANAMQSTTSKSASQDFSIQSSSIMPMQGKIIQNASGFTTPQVANFMGSNNFNYPSRSYFP